MEKNTKIYLVLVFLLLAVSIAGYLLYNREKEIAVVEPAIRVGWQSAWATQGQLAQVLQKTNVLKLHKLEADFKPFPYGAPLSEAALADELDVAFVGDQPAITLMSKGTGWKIVGRLMDFRVGIVTPKDSKIQSVADLKGKTLGIPFGASTHRVAMQELKKAGLEVGTTPDKVNIINIDIQEQNEIVKAGGSKQWKGVDAFASWDHHIANYENQNWARIISSGNALGVIMMSEKYLQTNRKNAIAFLSAFKMAYFYYAKHQEEANIWFAELTQAKFELTLLSKVAEVEPNIKAVAVTDVHTEITGQHKSLLQSASDFALQNNLIKTDVKIDNFVIDLDKDVNNLLSEAATKKVEVLKGNSSK